MRLFFVVALSIVSVIHAAIDSDKVTSLPGYAAGNLPSTHYSGCKLSVFNKRYHMRSYATSPLTLIYAIM